MPKSKRSQRVALTKTAKKTRDHKSSYIQTVRDAIDANDRLYLFSYKNMRSNHFKDVRFEFRSEGNRSKDKDSMEDEDDDKRDGEGGDGAGEGCEGRIFLGKNKLLQISLGRTPADEYSDNLHKVSSLLSGSVGILCTNRPSKKVEDYFSHFSKEDYARAGMISPRSVRITKEMVETHPVSMVEQFRKLGMPVEVRNGRVSFVMRVGELEGDDGGEGWEVCKEGKELTVEQCKILVHFGVKLAVFRIGLICRWEKEMGAVEEF